MKKDVPVIKERIKDYFMTQKSIQEEVLDRLKFKEKDYFLKLRVCTSIMKSQKLMEGFRKAMDRLKEHQSKEKPQPRRTKKDAIKEIPLLL